MSFRCAELPLINRHLGVCEPPPLAALRCRRPAHPLVSVFKLHGGWRGFLTPLHQPPSRGMRASSSRCAPMSSARTPTRVGFMSDWWTTLDVQKWLPMTTPIGVPKVCSLTYFSQHRWWVRRPDNIGAKRLAEGGVPASGAGSAKERRMAWHRKSTAQKNWNLTPISEASGGGRRARQRGWLRTMAQGF